MSIEPIKINISGRDFTVRPLNFAALKKLQPDIAKLSSGGEVLSLENMESMTNIIYTALVRDCPELTTEELDNILDMGNVLVVINAIMEAAGYRKSGEMSGENQ